MSGVLRRHPLLTPSSQVTGMVLVVSVVLALAAVADPRLLAFGVWAAAAGVAWGWAGTLGLPSPRGSSAVLALGAIVLVLAVAGRTEPPWLTWVPAAIGASMIAALVHQLLRRDGRPRLVESVTGVALALGVLASGAMLVPVSRVATGLVVAAMAAAAASAALDLLGRWRRLRPWLVPGSMVAGGLAAMAVTAGWDALGWPTSGRVADLGWTTVLLVGAGVGAVGHASRAVLSVLPTVVHLRPQLVSALTSVLLSGVGAYAVARVLLPEAFSG